MMTPTARTARLPAFALVLLLLTLAAPAAGEERSALDFTATALDGTPFSGSSIAGKAVLLDFWGSWCAPCVHAFPTLRQLHQDFGDQLEVIGLAYYSGELNDIAAFAAEYELEYTVLEGHEATLDAFEVFAFPSYVLISAEGEVLFSQAGELADLYQRVARALGSPSS